VTTPAKCTPYLLRKRKNSEQLKAVTELLLFAFLSIFCILLSVDYYCLHFRERYKFLHSKKATGHSIYFISDKMPFMNTKFYVLGFLLISPLVFLNSNAIGQAGRVGIGTTTPLAKLHVAGSQIIDSTLQFITSTDSIGAMINMFPFGTQNKDRMVLAHSPSYTNWGLQYSDSTDKFIFLSGGTPVLTTDLGNWRVGVGTSTPATKFDIAGTGSYNLASSEGDFRLGDATYRLKMGVANSGGGAGDAYIASSNRLYLGAGSTLGRTQTMSVNSNGMVGIGTASPAARLQVVGDTTTTPVIQATVTKVGSSDIRGIISFSKPADGWGYGVESTGGFIGGYFSGLSGAYTGTGFGVYGTASGTAGTRIGVYGTASGGTINNWGGYFPTKTYMNELRVGGEKGATGYVAAINGKLIAVDVKVDALANWPDYVFSPNHRLLPLEELEAVINKEKHLPGIPAATDVEKDGILLGEMQTKTMEKVEENTLYIIQLNKKIKELEKIIDELTKKIK